MEYFYYNSINKYVKIFGSLFADIYVRKVEKTGEIRKSIQVPIIYGDKAKEFIDEKQREPIRPQEVTLPSMAYILSDIVIDPERRFSNNNQWISYDKDNNGASTIKQPLPLNINFELEVWTQYQDEMHQIIEQIYSRYTTVTKISVKDFTPFDIKRDISIVLEGGQWTSERGKTLFYNDLKDHHYMFKFILKGFIYPYVYRPKLIKWIEGNWHIQDTNSDDINDSFLIRNEHYEPLPEDATVNDDYQIQLEITEDGRKLITVMEK